MFRSGLFIAHHEVLLTRTRAYSLFLLCRKETLNITSQKASLQGYEGKSSAPKSWVSEKIGKNVDPSIMCA